MFCLVHLYTDALTPPLRPFLPSFTLNGQPAKGLSYGKTMRDSAYSHTLTELLFECLYEEPRNRPTLQALKNRVHLGLETAIYGSRRRSVRVRTREGEPEDYEGFLDHRKPHEWSDMRQPDDGDDLDDMDYTDIGWFSATENVGARNEEDVAGEEGVRRSGRSSAIKDILRPR